jgi:radical SAM superfamily enzyme YgiQ (UPF0313 family)
VKVLLVSTYELGHQPLGVAGPAAAIAAAGHDVEVIDASMSAVPDHAADGVDAVIFSVPMHTATELALEIAARFGARGGGTSRPPFAFAGLYASVVESHPLLQPGDLLTSGDVVPALLSWLEDLPELNPGQRTAPPVRLVTDIGPSSTPAAPSVPLPARHLLPPLERYAGLLPAGSSGPLPAASIETTRGCNHRCRHCPVAVVYAGRSRPVAFEAVMADAEQAVSLGARHLSIADPDFLNRPRHALSVAHALRERFGAVTFDATIKVEHLLRHRGILDELAACGLTFVVSAFESTDDAVLSTLDKGHTAADEVEAVRLLRRAGIEPRPSWLPFTPWTTLGSIASLLELSARADLVWNTDAVQYAIRLLLPNGSLLLEDPDPVLEAALAAGASRRHGSPVSPRSRPWSHPDPRVDELQATLANHIAGSVDVEAPELFEEVWAIARDAGAPLAPVPPGPDSDLASRMPGPQRPRLTESWFCCAEPTREQLALVRS